MPFCQAAQEANNDDFSLKNDTIMNRKQIRKQTYVCPAIEVVHTASYNQLMSTSFPNNGGHNKAGDEEDMNAKQGWFDEDEEEENTP